ncbi:MAG: hypothetical protein ACJ8AW_54425 [Rhodopila sp.]
MTLDSTNFQTVIDMQAGSTPLSLTLAGFSKNPTDFTLQASDGTSPLGTGLTPPCATRPSAQGAGRHGGARREGDLDVMREGRNADQQP